MKQLNNILILIAMLALGSCVSDDSPTLDEPDVAISFNSIAGERTTRATATETGPLLHNLGYQTFGIWTWRTSDGSDWKTVMDRYHVSYDSQYAGEGRTEMGWGYDKESDPYHVQVLKYWNLSSTEYLFKGYAPWVNATSGSNPYISMDGDHNLLFHNISGHFAARAAETEYTVPNKEKMDWLYTHCKRTMTTPVPFRIDCDMTIDDHEKWYIGDANHIATKTVPLRYHHLLPKVVFRLHVYDGRTGHDMDVIYQKIGISVKPHDDTSDDTKDTQIFTKGENVSYEPTGTSPDLVYVTGTTTTTKGFSEFADKSPASPTHDWTDPTFRTFSKAAGTDYQDITPIKSDGSGQGWLELPQKAPVFDIKLQYDDVTYVRTLDPSINKALPPTWDPDHIYVYVIHFDIAAMTLEVTSYTESWSSTDDNFDITDW